MENNQDRKDLLNKELVEITKKILFGDVPLKMPNIDSMPPMGNDVFVHEPTGLSAHTKDELKQKIAESQWHDPEMTGLIPIPGTQPVQYWKPQEREYRVWDNKTGESRKANKDEIGEPITIKFERPLKFFQLAKNPQLSEPESSQLVASEKPELTNEEIIKKFRETPLQFFFTWQTKVQAYCTEQNISPDQLILDHQTYMALL